VIHDPVFQGTHNEPVCQKWNGEFRLEYSDWLNKWTTSRDDPEYSGRNKTKMDLSIWFPTEISSIFGIVEAPLDDWKGDQMLFAVFYNIR